MQAVILAAGRGKRMKGLTRAIAKPMLKIKGKPILEYKIEALPKKINEVIFVVGYRAEHIMNHFKRKYKGRKITYVFQHNLNGTGGALHVARSVLRGKFLVLMGDDLYKKNDIQELSKCDLAVLGYKVDNPGNFGVIKTNSRGNMVDIIEAPHKSKKYKLANTAVYVLNKKFFDYALVPKKPGDAEYGLPQTMAAMAKDYKVKVVKAHDWFQITSPEDLKGAEKVIQKFI